LPNLVPKSYLEIEPGECKKAIGWTGLLAAHPGDLEVTGGEVGRALVGRPDWDMGVLGEPKKSAGLVSTALGLLSEPVLDPFVDIRDYPYRMAEYGIGIVPLADTPFNAAKSALKMAQFAALGVPVVASPSPDNSRLNALGVGVLAADPHKWRRHLNRLVDSADARADLAGRGREVMATQTYERHADRWWRAWTGWM
jgi:hypothetical protein